MNHLDHGRHLLKGEISHLTGILLDLRNCIGLQRILKQILLQSVVLMDMPMDHGKAVVACGGCGYDTSSH